MSTLQLVFTAVWLFLAFAGWVLLMGGLSGFQKDINKHKNTDLWSIPANYPYLTPHHILRYKPEPHSCLPGRAARMLSSKIKMTLSLTVEGLLQVGLVCLLRLLPHLVHGGCRPGIWQCSQRESILLGVG